MTSRGKLAGSKIPLYREYESATQFAAAARKSVFGLFPSYRPEYLSNALLMLEHAHMNVASGQTPPGEALILHAKINYQLGNIDAMIPALRAAVEADGPSSYEARRLLDALRASRLIE